MKEEIKKQIEYIDETINNCIKELKVLNDNLGPRVPGSSPIYPKFEFDKLFNEKSILLYCLELLENE